MAIGPLLSRAAVAALCILSAEEARAFVTAPTGAPFHARLRGASAHRRQGSVACGMQLGENDAGTTPPLPSPDVIMGNVFEGKLGARGELYVGLQFALVFMVIIAPAFEDAFFAVGLFAGLGVSAAGLTLGYAGVRQLGDALRLLVGEGVNLGLQTAERGEREVDVLGFDQGFALRAR